MSLRKLKISSIKIMAIYNINCLVLIRALLLCTLVSLSASLDHSADIVNLTITECMSEGDPCDDGMFCNGQEFCDSNLNCISRSEPCTKCNEICDEEYSMCLEMIYHCANINRCTDAVWNPDTCECEYHNKGTALSFLMRPFCRNEP